MKTSELTLDLRSYSADTQSHQHDFHQLVLPVSGILNMSVSGHEGNVKQEQLALVAAGEEHAFAARGDNTFIVADVPTSLAPELERLPAYIDLDPALAHYVAFLHQQLKCGGSSGTAERQMLLLLIQLLQERFGEQLRLDKRIEVARKLLDQSFQRNFTLAELAATAHLSPRQFSELFRRQLGMTPQQYQTEKRMQFAWKLLESGGHTVQQVADQTGYTNLASFSDRFRKHFGKPPSYFRQNGK